MARHKVFYEFMENPSQGLRDPDKNWGEGELEADLAYTPETVEEWKNLSKEIKEYGNFAAVAVTRILPLEGNFQVTGDVIQGEIIAE